MKDAKKIKYNLIIGILGQAIALVLGIIVPKLVLTNYGSEVNGLLSSITNIYAYIAIVEAGVAAASCQALYKPIVDKNWNGANAVLSATNKYYHRTGIIYLVLILIFSLVYPVLVNTEISFQKVFLIILFNGIGNVVNYFFHGKYLILLRADGKNFIRTAVETFTNFIKQFSKIILIALGYDVIFVQLIAMFTSFVQMIYITLYIKRRYSWINLKAEPDMSSISQSKNVFIHEINYLITANIDTVLLTVFTTLKTVSVYSLYNLLFGTINRGLRTVRDSLEFKIAHAFHSDKNVFLRMFKAFEAYYIAFAFALFSITNYFILPFLSLYTKNVSDVNYINKYLPLLFVMTNLLSAGRYPSEAMVHISGHFKATQNSAIAESVINILSSVILVHFFDIAGVLIGTIISSLYRTIYLIIYVNKKIIGRKVICTCCCWAINFIVFLTTLFINQFIGIRFDSYIQIFAFCIPYAITVVALHLFVTSVFIPEVFRYVLSLFKKQKVSKNS